MALPARSLYNFFIILTAITLKLLLMAKNITQHWNADFLNKSPIFSDLKLLLQDVNWADWPGCSGLMALLKSPITLASGLTLDMKPQDDSLPFPEMGYEERVFKTGIISTREQSWHDLFNAFIWILFPQTKIFLNQLHMQELHKQLGKKRTPTRDAITHLDESGIIIASTDTQLLQSLKNHQWQQAFVKNRSCWLLGDQQNTGAFVFGHGMYEKAFKPFIGFTGKAYCLTVPDDFFSLSKIEQYKALDVLLRDDIKKHNRLADSRSLSPLPILDVPGWYSANSNPEFYNNKDYFRPKHVKKISNADK